MTDVRSAVLGRVASTAQRTWTLHTVPTGSTTLVKSIAVENDDAASQSVIVYAQSADGKVFATLVREQLQSATATVTQTWVAMEQGDRLMAALGPGCSAWASGAILNGVIPVQPPTTVVKPADEPPLLDLKSGSTVAAISTAANRHGKQKK